MFKVLVAILNFGFTFSLLSFFIKTLYNFVQDISGEEVNIWVFSVITVIIFSPVSWVRTIETFEVGYIFAVTVVLVMLITVTTLISLNLKDNSNEAGPGWTPFNENNFIKMWGLAFFMFEGIGAILPVMEASEYKDNFGVLLGFSIGTVCLVAIVFSELVYYTYGEDIKEPIIIK